MASTVGTIIPAYLLGNTSAESTVATWAAVTDGSFTISVDGTEVDVTGLDFSSSATMSAIATVIQTALQTATGNSDTVAYSSTLNRFKISSVNDTYPVVISAVSVATATGSGTDVSGATTTTSNYMDCNNARTCPYEVVLDLADMLDNVKAIVDDSSIDTNTFYNDINECYKIVLEKVYDYDPNWNLDYMNIDLKADYNVYDIPSNCQTIERVFYYASSTSDTMTNIPMTEFDEKIEKTELRWYRAGKQIVFRDNTSDIDDIKIYFRPKPIQLLAATYPLLPDNDYHYLFVYYGTYKYFYKENLETDWRIYKELFDDGLRKMLSDLETVSEPMTARISYEIGLP